MTRIFKKTDAYNPPTQYDDSKVYIIRIEQGRNPEVVGLLYKIVFRGTVSALENTELLMEQAQVHLRHENLTGFEPYYPWEKPHANRDLSERTIVFRQVTL